MDPRTAAWQELANPATSPDRLQQIANAYPEFWEVIVAALALLGGLLYWLPIGNKMNGGNSPEAAVRQLANSISSKDGAAVYGVLAPSERDPLVEMLQAAEDTALTVPGPSGISLTSDSLACNSNPRGSRVWTSPAGWAIPCRHRLFHHSFGSCCWASSRSADSIVLNASLRTTTPSRASASPDCFW